MENCFLIAPDKKLFTGIWQSTNEDLIVSRRDSDWFEIHCHGGNSACLAILSSLAKAKVSAVSAADFSLVFDQAWVVSTKLALAQATTAKTAKLLLNQLQVLPAAIDALVSMIESNQTELALANIEKLLDWSEFGIHLTQPRSIVLCGQPNVGKSSLANAIVGFQRAIVHDMPGTTRDVISQMTAIDGWPVELNDTAGLRDLAGKVEAIGIEKARAQIENADLRVCIFDLSRPWSDQDRDLLQSIQPQLVVHNKADLLSAGSASSSISDDRPAGVITSVETGFGIETMMEQISSLLVPDLPGNTQPFPVTKAQQQKLLDLVARLKGSPPYDTAGIYDIPMELHQ